MVKNLEPGATVESTTTWITEGSFAAKVQVDQFIDEIGWSPGYVPEAIAKLERVRLALRQGDIEAAKCEAEVFRMKPVA